jgi:processive 1,2-diacylglycerol beta-glucosyltransferase
VPAISPAPRILILSASIGEGHDLPARVLADDLHARRPDAHAPIVDSLKVAGPLVERLILGGSSFESKLGNWAFDLEYALVSHIRPMRRFASWLAQALAGRALLRCIARERPDVVVSTYPGTTEVLGRLRLQGRLGVPVVSAITDLAALRWWAHPGVDLHLITHPESKQEVRALAGPHTRIIAVRGLNDPRFAAPPTREQGREALGLPLDGKLVVVSGGGWGIGDLDGAVETALGFAQAHVVVMCGRNDGLRERLGARFGREQRVTLLGFTDQVPELFAAADALVHSTAGLTVLEAWVLGCPTISYGWGRGHIRANNRAYVEHGIADVARNRGELATALGRALVARRSPDPGYARLPVAADVVLELAGVAPTVDAVLVGADKHVGDGA